MTNWKERARFGGMKTKEEIAAEFVGRLKSLLSEYEAEIYAEDCFSGYAECGEDIRIKVNVPSLHDNGVQTRSWMEIDLGNKIWRDSLYTI